MESLKKVARRHSSTFALEPSPFAFKLPALKRTDSWASLADVGHKKIPKQASSNLIANVIKPNSYYAIPLYHKTDLANWFMPKDTDYRRFVADSEMPEYSRAVVDKLGNSITVGYRGTYSISDLWADSKFARTRYPGANNENNVEYISWSDKIIEALPFLKHDVPLVHSGILNLYKKTRDEIMSAISESMKKGERVKKINIVGHSLGGALAKFLALDLQEKYKNTVEISLIMYGVPPVGNEAFAKLFERKIPPNRVLDVMQKGDFVRDLLPGARIGTIVEVPGADGHSFAHFTKQEGVRNAPDTH